MLSHPILSCRESVEFERRLLQGSEDREWEAMDRAGRALGRAIPRDFQELRPFPKNPEILLLAGRGHNAGDALLATDEILKLNPEGRADLIFVYGGSNLRPLLRKCLDLLIASAGNRLSVWDWNEDAKRRIGERSYDVCIDGILGMQFDPPVRPPGDDVLEWANNRIEASFRVAVDLPTGVGDRSAQTCFCADFTYATGILKRPLVAQVNTPWVGRIVYLDIGFFEEPGDLAVSAEVLLPGAMGALRRLRSPAADKRSFGHLFLIGGSRGMPGAIHMAVRTAVRSGVGLVTACVPASIAPHLAASVPEAMWIPWPELPGGGLSIDGFENLVERLPRATALVAGPGMGTAPETISLLARVVEEVPLPMVLDADALHQSVVSRVPLRAPDAGRVILTPHMGECRRMNDAPSWEFSEAALTSVARALNAVIVLKGPVTKICDGERVIYSVFGGPVLARGGSGDVLSGLIGSTVAQMPASLPEAVCLATAWHGLAASRLARARGQIAVGTTELLDFLGAVLRHE